jgi:O-methyltransferase
MVRFLQQINPTGLVRSTLKTAVRTIGFEVLRRDAHEALLKRLGGEIHRLETEAESLRSEIVRLQREIVRLQREIVRLQREDEQQTSTIQDLNAMLGEYQLKLERKPDYQSIMAQDQMRAGMANLEPEFLELYIQCREFTMTSWERLYALYKSVLYVIANGIPGEFVECGVWRGGSMRLVAMTLLSMGVKNRSLYLYDTFEGMTEPTERDVDLYGNRAVDDWFQIKRRGVKWAYAPVEEVRDNIASTGYPMDKVKLVQGPVENTIPETIPETIAILRLDTDWYESTKHEVEHLYPRLAPEGVLAIDDYGHYQGARKAIDDYFVHSTRKPLLNRIDYACRFAVKPRE